MIRATRRASLLGAFYLLTSTATAYAECAWVLWHEVTPPGEKPIWRLIIASETLTTRSPG